jgi:hypothetical protein
MKTKEEILSRIIELKNLWINEYNNAKTKEWLAYSDGARITLAKLEQEIKREK